MKEWLEICEEFHAEECAKEIDENTANIPSCLRVIDVEENRLVTVTPGLRYIALSYVWGQVSSVFQYRTTKSNFQRRTEKGGLDGVVFPRTIRDAIVLVGLLGQRYLWVDAVCIIQDDDTDQAVQISSMNIIYGASHLTVVAASGSDAEAGLSRAHADSPSADLVQHMETVQGVRMMLPLKKIARSPL
ncbi:heterokaryon incompatibility protein-domain-containing protein [Trichophaea hybrida]|nr:heterokaryon incompatibility protein-domain-containing protein [Trichophaea hybrida]